MTRIAKYYNDNKIFLWGIMMVFIYHIFYLMSATVNIPVMDYWTYIYEYTDKIFMGRLSIADFWANYTSHRAPFQYFLFCMNVYWFEGNTLVAIYLGAFVTFITTLTIYEVFRKTIGDTNSVFKQLGMIFIGGLLFSLNQWEIMTLEFSAAFSIRILLFVCIFTLIEKLCRGNDKCCKYYFEIAIFIFVVILFFSSSYFPAMVLSIASIMIMTLVITKEKKQFFKYCLTIGSFAMVATLLYTYKLNMNLSTNEMGVIEYLVEFIKAIIIMLSSSIVHSNNLNENNLVVIGLVVAAIYIVTFLLYIKEKMYNVTYMPLMLMIYSIASIVLISYGRMGAFSVLYLMASRYVCETILGWVGIVWILLYVLAQKKRRRGNKLIRVIGVIIILFVVICWGQSNMTEREMSVYRKAYMETLQEKALHIEDYADEELTDFQANNPKYIREGIELMRKYHLGIFEYEQESGVE